MEITRLGLSATSHADAWGDPKKPKSDMAYLLLAPDQLVEEEKKFWLVAMWTHPCQAYLPSLDKVARKLALLISTGEDWVYAFMQLNEAPNTFP